MTWLRLRLELYWRVCPDRLNRLRVKFLRKMIKIAGLPLFFLRFPWLLRPDLVALQYIEMPLTTRCTLRCAKCSNLMQYYERIWDLPSDQALRYIDIMLKTVNHIFDFGLIGGETFLYENLPGIITHLCGSRKVSQISLTTNGTVLPKDAALLRALAHRKVLVKISRYGALSHKLQDLTELFAAKKIRYTVIDMSHGWYDFGAMHFRGRNAAQLNSQFRICASGCHSYIHGRLHYCPRSAHGVDLGLVPDDPRDYADLGDAALSRKQRRKEVRRILDLKFITACNYCDKGTPLHVPIPAAVQMVSRGGNNHAGYD